MRPERPLPSHILAVSAGCLLTVCCAALLPTPVQRIIDNPREFEGKTVVVRGEVTEATSLLVVKYFVVTDESGSIRVLTDRSLPKVGQQIRVRGVVKDYDFGVGRFIVIQETGQ